MAGAAAAGASWQALAGARFSLLTEPLPGPEESPPAPLVPPRPPQRLPSLPLLLQPELPPPRPMRQPWQPLVPPLQPF